MGYGPLVRAATGVTSLWTSDQPNPGARHPFYDATTIFPDHVVGRITAIGALAGLIRRMRAGIGARIHVSQAEAGINQLDTRFVMFAAEADDGGADVCHDETVHLVLPCAGDDEWCVVSLQSGDPGLPGWAARHTPGQVADRMQAAGVPAGPMNRPDDVYEHPQLRWRNILSDMTHPLFEVPLPAETGPAPFRNIPLSPQRPAPLPGADTRRVCREVLGLSDGRIEQLIDAGVLFAADTEKGVPQ